MKIFFKILGFIVLIVVVAAASLGIGGYFIAREADKIISEQLLTQAAAAETLQEKAKSWQIDESKTKGLDDAIVSAKSAAENSKLNLLELINAIKLLGDEVAKTIDEIPSL